MTNNQEFHQGFTEESENSSFSPKDIIVKYIYHWPVFIVGIIICITFAFLYLRYATQVYLVNSTLLIKDEKKNSIPSGGDLLNELDLFGNSKVVENEIEILKSKTLMRKVVTRLSLSISLNAEGRVKNSNLYAAKLVKFGIVRMDSSWYGTTLRLSFPSRDTYQLEDIVSSKKFIGKFNKLERTLFGVFEVKKGIDFDVLSKYPVSLSINDPLLVADQYLGQLNVSLASKQSTVLSLTFQSDVPEIGEDILNTLVQVYNEAALADKNKTTQSTIQFIDDRLKLITGELTEVEQEVETFKSSRGLTDLSNDANLFLESVKVNDAKLNEVNLQISVIQDVERYINSESPNEKLPSTLGINDPVLLGQITQLGELQLQRDQLLATTTAQNPLVVPLAKQIETTRAGIKTTISNIYKSLRVAKADLEGNNSQFQGSIKKVPGQERQLISIKRQQSIKESLYLYLLQKKEEAALSYASAVADSRTVDPAYYSKLPIKPKRQLVYITSILLGLLLPVGFLFLKETLNDKLEDTSALTKITTAPILGEVMLNEGDESIVVHENSRKAIAEQFRAIRTNLQFVHGKFKVGIGNVTLLTSSMSGEGKTFIASNIATALALSGKRTILLELDLRKPKVSKYLKLNNHLGISNYLIGKAKYDDIIQSTIINSNLFIIGSGPIPPNPSELLIQDEIDILFKYLRQNYDEIIIDTPPIGLDAQILSRVADATIYVVRQNVTFKDQIKSLQLLYKSKKLPALNVILNGAKGGGKYGYGYGYYADDHRSEIWSFKKMFKEIMKRF
jgi:tyrosine-protein kinase Etk/Wzc